MRKFAVSIVVFMTVSASICWGQTLRRAEDYYARGQARKAKGDVEGAIADFGKAIEILPNYSSAYVDRCSRNGVKLETICIAFPP